MVFAAVTDGVYKLAICGVVSGLLLLVMLYLMIWKPGA